MLFVKPGNAQPIAVGAVTALVGFAGSFAVVLAGLVGVGASTGQATTGLVVLCALTGILTVLLSTRYRRPLLLAWSTPGAVVLAATGVVQGGWAAAVGAFMVTGLLFALTAAVPGLSQLIARIPTPVAHAMLAGVLLSFCLKPVVAVAANPLLIGPVVVVWILLTRFAARWATPIAFALALAITIGAPLVTGRSLAFALPQLTLTSPAFTAPAIIGIAVPLYIVTMASQNLAGAAVISSFGYQVPWRPTLLLAGAGTMLGAPAGAHALNLAAITAALPASPDAHPDPQRRWIAASAAGWTYLLFGALTPVLVALAALAPAGLIDAVAGLALMGTLVSSLAAATAERSQHLAVAITFLVAASPIVFFGIGASFWSLVIGVVIWSLFAGKS